MKKILSISILLLSCFALSASAHRLNEYLQATTISLGNDSAGIRITLTPGSDISKRILMDIDKDGDGIISYKEEQAYASSILLTLSVNMDGHPLPLHLMSWHFATPASITKGMGDIQLFLTAAIANPADRHRLIFKNKEPATMAVYLVNCLMPEDSTIRITGQSRSVDQSYYAVDFTTGNTPGVNTPEPKELLAKTADPAVFKSYVFHGIHHILAGYDHLLFLCALVLGATSLWSLIKIITAFTIAHSVTLTLAALGLAHVPGYFVEPFIAASIVYVAVQNIFWPRYANGTGRICAAFIFGLFHGLGFAGGLLELMHAMPPHLVFYAIIGFSVGVEAGNQMVLLPLYGLLQSVKRVYVIEIKPKRAEKLQLLCSSLIAMAGVYYLFISITLSA